jgi:hypothetical protein
MRVVRAGKINEGKPVVGDARLPYLVAAWVFRVFGG